MISYIRNNYPEDFNDYIETPEFLALIDSNSWTEFTPYRVDMNARENYLNWQSVEKVYYVRGKTFFFF